MGNQVSLRNRVLRLTALALSSSAVLLSGCALQNTATESGSLASAAVLSGTVHGGQQPISNATVTLYAAGNAGYGSAAKSLATATTDANGGFSFHPVAGATYSCPLSTSTTSSQYLYLVVTGGQPTPGVTNSVEAEMLALGNCTTALATNPSVVITEETTIAGMFALQQFFAPSVSGLGNIGTSSTNITGLANAMTTANSLVSTASGQSGISTVGAALSGYTTPATITITPEIAKINTEADILAACINSNPSSSTVCTTLFNAVSATPATDTLQAAYYMATNPTSTVGGTSNIATIYALTTSNPPFSPTLTAAPSDWSLGVTYGSSSTSTAGVYLLTDPTYLAIDASGNVWALNDASSSATSIANSVIELSPAGTPLTQIFTGAGVLVGPSAIAIDPTGNVWVSNYGSSSSLASSILEYTTLGVTNTFTTSKGPQRMAIDGKGNLFVLEPSYKGPGDLEEITAGSTSGSSTTLATGITTDFSNLAIDANYTVWVTGGGTGALGGTTGYPAVFQFLYSATAPNYATTPNNTVTVGGVTAPEQAISIDSANNVFVQNYASENLAKFSGTTTVVGASGAPYTMPANLTKPEFQITDGAGNLWVSDAATTTATPAGTVFEVSNAGVPLGPTTGFAHTYNEPYGIVIDLSGNVWVAAYNAAGPAGFITEIVGAAVPVVTPLAAGLPVTPGGTSRLGTRP